MASGSGGASSTQQGKKVWSAPRLHEFGKVSALTQSGSGGPSESQVDSASGMTCSKTYKVHNMCPGV